MLYGHRLRRNRTTGVQLSVSVCVVSTTRVWSDRQRLRYVTADHLPIQRVLYKGFWPVPLVVWAADFGLRCGSVLQCFVIAAASILMSTYLSLYDICLRRAELPAPRAWSCWWAFTLYGTGTNAWSFDCSGLFGEIEVGQSMSNAIAHSVISSTILSACKIDTKSQHLL